MARYAWTARLRPENVDDYVRDHAAVWPDVLEAIRAAGIRDYSIWLFEDRVFAQYEVDGDHDEALRLEAGVGVGGRARPLHRPCHRAIR